MSSRLPALLLAALLSLGLVAGCGSSDATEVRSPEDVADALEDGALLVDVRTPAEVAQGDLPTAVMIDAESEDFEAVVAALDPDESYVVYCATGRRASLAIERMQDAGIEDVVNGGGYEDLLADDDVREALAERVEDER